jgi:hypothetical protein
MMKIAFRVIFIFKMAADNIGKISLFSNFNENWYLGLFWSEELIGNDENCIQGHFYDATVSKMTLKSDHWQFDNFVGSHFENGGLLKKTLNANFIITNQFLTSKYS